VSAVRDRGRPVIAAIGFLTAIPTGRRREPADDDLRRGLVFFPLVGAVVGGVTGLVAWACSLALPSVPAAVLGVAAGVAATGALHLDGLADTADGVGAAMSGGDPAEAMSDPRLGTFGGAALVLDLALKVSVLAALVDDTTIPWETVAAGGLGRTVILGLALAIPYAGAESGEGAWTQTLDRRRCLVGVLLGLATGGVAVGIRLLPMTLATVIVAVVVGRWSARHRAGMRGDTFGAAAELSETLALTAALATS